MAQIEPKISVDYTDGATIVKFLQEKILEDKDIQQLRQSIMSVIEQADSINLILDFSNVRFLSSAVLGLLIRVSKKVYENEGTLKLCCIDRKIYEIFKITRLTECFDIYGDIGNAVDAAETPTAGPGGF